MKFWKYIFIVLLLVASTVWLSIFFFSDNNLHLITCDVGQGDAILVVFNKTQILIDGGPNNKIINCLSKHLPFWDRTLEAVFLTHSQKDHYQGLINVFERYKVDYFFANTLESGDPEYQVLKNLVRGSNTKVINPTSGLKVGNSLIYLDIVWPLEDLETEESIGREDKLNEFSIVSVLNFGEFSALLTGDIESDISDQLSDNQLVKKTIVLKVPHHGSKNGLTKNLLEIIKPQVAVISVGKNSYGHPHKETLDLLNEFDVRTFRTDISGDIEVVTNGKKWWKENHIKF